MQSAIPAPLTTATFLSRNRGGGLYSETVSQRIGAVIALVSHRLRLAPSALTITGTMLGVGTSVVLVALAPLTTTGAGTALVLGLATGVGWQLAYAFDCADGQLARVTNRTSAAGGRLDVLCDVATQISVVAALAAVAAAQSSPPPGWLSAAFAGTWMVNLVTSALASGQANASLIPSRGGAVRLIKLVRDYGAVIGACSLVIAIVPQWTVILIATLAAFNGLFLVASLAQAARRAFATTDHGRDVTA